MTTLMDGAIDKLRALPPERRDQFARFLPHELATDAHWARTTGAHAAAADPLIAEVMSAHRRGETEPLDVDRL